MFRPERQVSVGLIVGLGAAASAALAALYILCKKDDENFELDPRIDVTTSASFQSIRSTTIHKNVPAEATGAVIGRGGDVIRQIQRKTNTKITFSNGHPNDDVDRTLLIRGSPTGVLEADEMIDQIIETALSCVFQKIYIDASEVGYIIGKNGATVKSISEESGAKVNFPKHVKGVKTGRVPVEIRGDPVSVQTAIKMIDDKLKACRMSSNVYCSKSNSPRSIFFIASRYNIEDLSPQISFEKLESNFDNGCVDVYVSSVRDPFQFWVQPCGTKSADLDRLMVEMTEFYEKAENCIKAKLESPRVGDIAAAPLKGDEHWFRVKIVKIDDARSRPGEAEITVFYLDFGNEAIILEDQICALHEEFLFKLPLQAIECSLFGVSPGSESGWSKDAIDYFKKLARATLWEKVFAKTVKVTPIENEPREHYSIELIDIKGDTDLNIASSLIEKGYAVSNNS